MDLDIAVLLLDETQSEDAHIPVMMSIGTDGQHHCLRLGSGSLGNVTVCKALLVDLGHRGLCYVDRRLFTLAGWESP